MLINHMMIFQRMEVLFSADKIISKKHIYQYNNFYLCIDKINRQNR